MVAQSAKPFFRTSSYGSYLFLFSPNVKGKIDGRTFGRAKVWLIGINNWRKEENGFRIIRYPEKISGYVVLQAQQLSASEEVLVHAI
jgi:hypothetical protein